jgi:hypothetical protein
MRWTQAIYLLTITLSVVFNEVVARPLEPRALQQWPRIVTRSPVKNPQGKIAGSSKQGIKQGKGNDPTTSKHKATGSGSMSSFSFCESAADWALGYIITPSCISTLCKNCVDATPADTMSGAGSSIYIHPDEILRACK